MSEEPPAKVTLGHLVRAERICARRLRKEHDNARSNFGGTARWKVGNRVTEEVRLAHTDLCAPGIDRFDGTAADLTAEQQHVFALAVRWYVTLFERAVRVVDEDAWGTDLPGDLRLVGPAGLAFTGSDGRPEIRILRLGSRVPAAASSDSPAVRFALLRRTDWLRDREVRVAVADLVHGTLAEEVLETGALMPELWAWLDDRIAVIRERMAAPRPTAGVECAWCPYIAGCEAHA
ncbi:MAG TPA: hypothetical protein VGN59_18400 [Acidimicrobiia bacterium]|jgi:hypothetical protein